MTSRCEVPAEAERIRQVLIERYGLPDPDVIRFSVDHQSYRADSGSATFVVRLGEGLERHAAALTALDVGGCPAPRIVPAADGALIAASPDGEPGPAVLVTTFIEGRTPRMAAADLHRLGVALGDLHKRGPATTGAGAHRIPGLPLIDRAGMLPENELDFALRCLLPVQARLAGAAAERQWQALVDDCRCGLVPVDGLTHVFLHGDAHPWNSVITADGTARFYDWDAAGPGPAIIDLGFLVLSCAGGGLTGPVEVAPADAVSALLAGYRSRMTLEETDLGALDAAVRFRLLVNLAAGFAHFVERGQDPLAQPSIGWSQQRLRMVPRIVETIRAGLTR